jgi:hypothetical protein
VAYPPLSATEVFKSLRFRRWFIALSSILEHPLMTYIRERLELGMTDQDIAERLAPLLAGVTPVREELIERAWGNLAKFLTLEPDEKGFITAVQQGELRSELLFSHNSEEAGRIAAHPAILWKIQNVRNYLARPGRSGKVVASTKRRKS